uniref:Uncharacterized protein n=1 Tax=viral metagenome TaxID=1070528 RepID=A0A6H1ZY51_9ZZZZ
MSVYGTWKAATIASAASSSAEVDLGRDYDFLEIQIPPLDAASTIKIQVAEKTGGTFYDLGDGITTDAGTHNYADVFNLGGYQYIMVVADNTQDAQRLIRVRGMRY